MLSFFLLFLKKYIEKGLFCAFLYRILENIKFIAKNEKNEKILQHIEITIFCNFPRFAKSA